MWLIYLLASVCVIVLLTWKWVSRPTLPAWDGKEGDRIIKVGFTKKELSSMGEPDVIVVGSGLGGLTTAALLAKRGKKVLVLEQHDRAGGCTHSFEEKGYEFDIGLHYVGGAIGEGSGLKELFDDLCTTKVEWASQGEVFDVCQFPNHRVEWKNTRAKTRAALLSEFPEEAQAIDRYLEEIKKGNDMFGMSVGLRVMPRSLRRILEPLLKPFYAHATKRTTLAMVQSLTTNKELQNVLCYLCGDYGLPPSKSTWAIHACTLNHFLQGGGYYPVGGAAVIAKAIVPTIVRAGGRVLVRAKVSKYLMEEGRCVGVVVNKRGTEYTIKAPIVVSAVGAVNTARLLPDEAKTLWADPFKCLESGVISPSCAHVQLFMGFKGSQDELQLPAYNSWIYLKDGSIDKIHNEYYAPLQEDETHRKAPFFFAGFPSAKDPSFKDRFPGKSVCTIVTEAPYEWFHKWNDAKIRHRGPEYEALKKVLSDELMTEVYKLWPQLKGRLEYLEVGTPVTNNHYLGVGRGESYGLEASPARIEADWLSPETPIPGLWLSGQDVTSAGVFGAMFGGYVCAFAMDKRILINHALSLIKASNL